ncbi:hypothetical protein, partial [Shigella flexneri]
ASSLSSGEYLPGSLQDKILSDDCLEKEQMVVSAIASTPQAMCAVTDRAEPRQPDGCKLKTAPVRPVVAARSAEYVCSEDLFY